MQAEGEIARQNRDLLVQKAAYQQETEEARAKAEMAYKIEQERINKTFATEHAAAEMTRLEKLTELKRQEVEIEREKLNVEIREKAQAEKEQNTETQKQSENPGNPDNPESPENPDKTEKLESPEKPTTEVTPQ